MRKNLRAFHWPRATSNQLLIAAALTLAAQGCSKPSAVTQLPDTDGKALVEAEERTQTRQREEALAGSPKAPASPRDGALPPRTDERIARTESSATTIDRSGLKTPAATEGAARSRSLPPAARSAKAPLPNSLAAREEASPGPAARGTQVSGASWAGPRQREPIETAAAEKPGIASLDSRPAADAQEKSSSRSNETRFQIDRLMVSARILLTRGELFSAYRTALLAERVAEREQVPFTDDEEHPGDLVRLIDREITLAGQSAPPPPASRNEIPSKAEHASKNALASATGETPHDFEEAASRFATWRSDEPTSRTIVQTGFPVPKSQVQDGTVDDFVLKPHGAHAVSKGNSEEAWTAQPEKRTVTPEESWKTSATHDSSPVVLSSAISSEDDHFVPGVSGLIVPAVDERASGVRSNPFEVMTEGDTLSSNENRQLFVPTLQLPPGGTPNAKDKAQASSSELAFGGPGPLLPGRSSDAQGLDNIWEEELIAAASVEEDGFSAGAWALTGIMLAVGTGLFAMARWLRNRRRA